MVQLEGRLVKRYGIPTETVFLLSGHVQLRLCVLREVVWCRHRQLQCRQFLRALLGIMMNILIPTEYFRSPYASIIPGLIYSIGAMGGGYSDVLNMNGSYGNCFFFALRIRTTTTMLGKFILPVTSTTTSATLSTIPTGIFLSI